MKIVNLLEQPDLEPACRELGREPGLEFMQHIPASRGRWSRLWTDFAAHQVALLDERQKVIATGNSIPFAWNGSDEGLPAGWDAVLTQGCDDFDAGRPPTAASALYIVVTKDRQGQGLSALMIRALKDEARTRGVAVLFAPVRPTQKAAYPLTPFDRYVRWTRSDGSLFDPWLRTHSRIGGRILGVCPQSSIIPGTVAQWEAWTGMRFPETGDYVVPGALVRVHIDVERDHGLYVEPNVWVRHEVAHVETGVQP
jgi:GNAT superfamily N-acetyltransferase